MRINKVKMYHPWKRDEYGAPKIVSVNANTVKKGVAEKLGYTRVPTPEAPPVQVAAPVSTASAPTSKPKVTPAPVVKGGTI
jgi:hypothetical protein